MNQTFRKLRDNRIDLEKRLQDAREQELSYASVCMEDVREVLLSIEVIDEGHLLYMERNNLSLREFLLLCVRTFEPANQNIHNELMMIENEK